MAKPARKTQVTMTPPARNEAATGISDDRMFALRWQRGQKDLVGPLGRLYGSRIETETLL